jgi:hypothetical protein
MKTAEMKTFAFFVSFLFTAVAGQTLLSSFLVSPLIFFVFISNLLQARHVLSQCTLVHAKRSFPGTSSIQHHRAASFSTTVAVEQMPTTLKPTINASKLALEILANKS